MLLNLSETMVKLRRDKQYTQEQLAGMLGVSVAAVSKWETGNSYPDITLLPQIAQIYDVSMDYLFSYQIENHPTVSETIEKANMLMTERKYDEAIILISNVMARYPNNEDLIYELAKDKFFTAQFKNDNERKLMIEEAEIHFKYLIGHTQDEMRRAWTNHYLTTIAIIQKDYDKARFYNRQFLIVPGIYPRSERAVIEIGQHADFDSIKFCKEMMEESIKEYVNTANYVIYYHLDKNEQNEAINESNRVINILKEYNKDGKYNDDISILFEGIAYAYAQINDFENCLANLELAVDYALNELKEQSGKLSHRTSCKSLLMTLKSNDRREYDSIRDSAQYKKLMERLEKH